MPVNSVRGSVPTAPGSAADRSYFSRVLRLLEAVSIAAVPIGVMDAAELVGLPPNTASRQLQLLESLGFVYRLPTRQYVPSARLARVALGVLGHLGDMRGMNEAVAAIAGASGESSSVGLLVEREVILAARAESSHPLRVSARVGSISEPHSSALGKAVLAHVSTQLRLEMLKHALGKQATQISHKLEPDLERIRTEGVAADDEESAVGLRCRAVPFFDQFGRVAGAISVAGPSNRLTAEIAEKHIPKLKAQAKLLSTSWSDHRI